MAKRRARGRSRAAAAAAAKRAKIEKEKEKKAAEAEAEAEAEEEEEPKEPEIEELADSADSDTNDAITEEEEEEAKLTIEPIEEPAKQAKETNSTEEPTKEPDSNETTEEADNTTSNDGTLNENKRHVISHWYPEPFILRRCIKGAFSSPTIKELVEKEPTNDDSVQLKLLRNTFTTGALKAELWDKLGYITSQDDKPTLQTYKKPTPPPRAKRGSRRAKSQPNEEVEEAAITIEKDSYGLPLDHVHYPLVARCQGRWFLLCSWMNKCREHHSELFCEDLHNIKRRSCEVPGRVSQNIPWEALIHAEATKYFGTEISPICNDVINLDKFVLPKDVKPAEAAGKTLADAFPGHSQLRNIWHTPIGNNMKGMCSLVPTSKLSGEVGGKFYAVEVACDKDKNWIPSKALVEITITDMPSVQSRYAYMNLSTACKNEESKIDNIHHLLPEFMSPPKGKVCKIDRIVVIPDESNFTTSVYQMWPTADAIRTSDYAPLDLLTVVRIVHGRIVRVVLRKKDIVIGKKTLTEMEENVKIDAMDGAVFFKCTEFEGASVVIEFYSPSTPFPRVTNKYPSVVTLKKKKKEKKQEEKDVEMGEDNETEIKKEEEEEEGEEEKEKENDKEESEEMEEMNITPSFTYTSSHYCRCDFTLLTGCDKTTVTFFPKKKSKLK